MPEKKPVPPPAPRNRHERRKRATEERRARPWLPRIVVTMTGEWFTFSPGCAPTFKVTGEMDRPSNTVTGSLAVVHWRSKDNGVTGHGKAIAADLAQAWADDGNRRYPDMEHWVVPVTNEPVHVPENVAAGDVVVVPGEDGKPELRPYQERARLDAADDYKITEISLVTITPEIVAKVAEKTGRTVDAVNAYLAGPEQDRVLLDAFLFYGVGPMGKVVVTGGFTRRTGPSDPGPASFDREH